ncbi:hypothetical protein AB751O23_AR_00020 [Chlamydiales bacterium SCGC AB-751-O23]|jgi:hypothetical protein|nr:hypothetical protein AB751O23_AR_00020 [Chlamydiales bacterium SCGC AB-751-O23]
MLKTYQKIFLILHLCICFSLLTWQASKSFAENYYLKKDTLQIYENIIGHPQLIKKLQDQQQNSLAEKLTRHQSRFITLKSIKQNEIKLRYEALIEEKSHSWPVVIKKVFQRLAFDIPPLFQAWLLFSFVTAFLIFYPISGGRETLCLLPLTLAIYLFFIPQLPPLSDSGFRFPTEEELTKKYLNESPIENNQKQQAKLLRAWKLYLIDQWNPEKDLPSIKGPSFEMAAEEGEFRLNIFRSEKRWEYLQKESRASVNLFHSNFLTYSLIIWSFLLCFALFKKH